MKKTITFILSVLAFGMGVYLLVIHFTGQKSIGYVNSQDLIYNYQGTQDMTKEFEKVKNELGMSLDTMKTNLAKEIEAYKKEMPKLNRKEKLDREEYIEGLRKQLYNYSITVEDEVNEKDQEMMQAVLNQINSFVKEYAVENKYSLILGTTSDGNILYGEDAMDITDELLEALNNNYYDK